MQHTKVIGLDTAKSAFRFTASMPNAIYASTEVEAAPVSAILQEAAALSDRNPSLCRLAPLIACAAGARAYGNDDAAAICETLCEVKGQYDDATNAEPICEAATSPNMAAPTGRDCIKETHAKTEPSNMVQCPRAAFNGVISTVWILKRSSLDDNRHENGCTGSGENSPSTIYDDFPLSYQKAAEPQA